MANSDRWLPLAARLKKANGGTLAPPPSNIAPKINRQRMDLAGQTMDVEQDNVEVASLINHPVIQAIKQNIANRPETPEGHADVEIDARARPRYTPTEISELSKPWSEPTKE